MGRAPCCEKMGLKKGPWTGEEDQILINYINKNGHENWRALPQRAGLLRCGKSCRLRWMNYLRPDIKRGNFTREEEEEIIKLHSELGNKLSEIASRLSGRTDNEIKNVWHTKLKKRLTTTFHETKKIRKLKSTDLDRIINNNYSKPISSPVNSSSGISSVTTADAVEGGGSGDINVLATTESLDGLTEMDERFWSEVFPMDDWSGDSDFSSGNNGFGQIESANLFDLELDMESRHDFWHDMFYRVEDFTESFDF